MEKWEKIEDGSHSTSKCWNYGLVFLMMISTVVENTTPTTRAKAIKRLKEMHSLTNSATRMARTSVSTKADNKIHFFLFIFILL